MPSFEAFPVALFAFMALVWLGGLSIFFALLFHSWGSLLETDPARKWLRYRLVPIHLRIAAVLMVIGSFAALFGSDPYRGLHALGAFAMAVVLWFAAGGADRFANAALSRIPRKEEAEDRPKLRVVNGGKR